MIISFSNTPLVIAAVLGLAILVGHVLSAFYPSRWARVLTPIGILLHVGALVLLFFAGASFDLLVACLLVSVFVYSLSEYIARGIGKGGSDE
jgi:predicted MFS family arabinose efflux permease